MRSRPPPGPIEVPVAQSDSFTKSLLALGEMLRRLYLRVVEDEGISVMHIALLHTLQVEGPMKMADLTAALYLSKGNLTYHVDRLEELGWVKRGPSPDDRRITLLSVCPDGSAVLERVQRGIQARVDRLVEGAPPTEVIMIKAGLDLLLAREALLLDPEEAGGA